MKIAVYINEESLQGQLCDSVAEAINNLLAVINTLASNQSVEVSVLTSSAIFSKRVCAGTGLTLAQLDKTDHDLFVKFKEVLDKGKQASRTFPPPAAQTDTRLPAKRRSADLCIQRPRNPLCQGRARQ